MKITLSLLILQLTITLLLASLAAAETAPGDQDFSWLGQQRVSNETGIGLCIEDDFDYALSVKREYCEIALLAPNTSDEQRGQFELSMCRISIMEKDFERAEVECERSLEYGSRSIDKLEYVILLYKRTRRFEEVIPYSREAVALRPDQWHWWQTLLDGLIATNDVQEALTVVDAYGRQFGTHHHFLFLRCRLLLMSGDPAAAEALAEQMRGQYPTFPLGHLLSAEIALKKGDVNSALNHFEAAENLASRDSSGSPIISSLANVQNFGRIYSEFHLWLGLRVFHSMQMWDQVGRYSSYFYRADSAMSIYSQAEIRELNAIRTSLISSLKKRKEDEIASSVQELQNHLATLELLISALEADNFDCQGISDQQCSETIADYIELVYIVFSAANEAARSKLSNSISAPSSDPRAIVELERSNLLMALYQRGFELNSERQSLTVDAIDLEVVRGRHLDHLLRLQLESIWNVEFYVAFFEGVAENLVRQVGENVNAGQDLESRIAQLNSELNDVDRMVVIALEDRLWGATGPTELSFLAVASLTEIQRMFVSATSKVGRLSELLVQRGGQKSPLRFDTATVLGRWQGVSITGVSGGIGWVTFQFDASSDWSHVTCQLLVRDAGIIFDAIGGGVQSIGYVGRGTAATGCRSFSQQQASGRFADWFSIGQFVGPGEIQFSLSKLRVRFDFVQGRLP